jgi:hypothetical protein
MLQKIIYPFQTFIAAYHAITLNTCCTWLHVRFWMQLYRSYKALYFYSVLLTLYVKKNSLYKLLESDKEW